MEMLKLQKITPHKEMAVQRITVGTTQACVLSLGLRTCGWATARGLCSKMSFNQYTA